MLFENDVVDSIHNWLDSEHYTDIQARKGTQKGHDIQGVSPTGAPIYVECKGAISERTGQVFSRTYQWQAVSGALFNQLRLRQRSPQAIVAMAFPKDAEYREMLKDLEPLLINVQIQVYWVDTKTKAVECGFDA